jgi:2-hydroxyacyl-CoA lyase
MTIDGHCLAAQSLRDLGVTHVYCLAGTPIRETFAKCAELGMRPIGVRHQQTGVLMALAQNYLAGRMTAVTLLSAGPAITNAATGILVARDNCWPLVVLGGRRPLSMHGMGSFQELDAALLFQSITKWSAVVEETAQIPSLLEKAFRIAISGRPGPVYLDLPEDVLCECGVARKVCLERSSAPVADDASVARAAELLGSAARPAMIIGKGVRWSEPYAELLALADEFAIPFIASPMGRGFLPDDHPLCFNDARSLLQRQADVILLLGARLDWTFRFGAEFARNAQIVQIDIESSEIGANKAATVGITGDVKSALQGILKRLREQGRTFSVEVSKIWHEQLTGYRKANQQSIRTLLDNNALPMSPYCMLKEIRDFLPRDGITVLDGNVSMAVAQQVLPNFFPASRFTAGNNGCMGVGIPFGIGAKLCQPERLVLVICGDTAAGFNIMELETAARHRIPVIVVVANNQGNNGGLVETVYFGASQERITMYQPDLRYDQIAAAFGAHAEHVERPGELPAALERAVASGLPACIDVRVDPYAAYPADFDPMNVASDRSTNVFNDGSMEIPESPMDA